MPNCENRENCFFIGANTAGGFVSHIREIVCAMRKVYILKGGPGTGKSTFMRRLAEDMEALGYPAERYYCSSDSLSLDGIVFRDLGVAVVDGTPPHVWEASCPGAVEELIDLGAYWNSRMLAERVSEIRAHNEEKASLFSGVYKYLSVGKVLHSERQAILLRCSDADKADRAAERLIRRLGGGAGFSLMNRQITSIGMQGRTVLPTYERAATEHWVISDHRGLAGMMFENLLRYAEKSGLAVWISRDPMQEIEALFFPEKGVSVTLNAETADRVINTERFLCREALALERARLRFLTRLEKELFLRVEEAFSEIKRCHFALEGLYYPAMDFDRVAKRRTELLHTILALR